MKKISFFTTASLALAFISITGNLQTPAYADFQLDQEICAYGFFDSGSGYTFGYFETIPTENTQVNNESGSGSSPATGSGPVLEPITEADEESNHVQCSGYGFGNFDEYGYGFFDFGNNYEFGYGYGYGYGFFDSIYDFSNDFGADAVEVDDDHGMTLAVSEEDLDMTFTVDVQEQDSRDLALRHIAASMLQSEKTVQSQTRLWLLRSFMIVVAILCLIISFHKARRYFGKNNQNTFLGLTLLALLLGSSIHQTLPIASADKNMPNDFADANEIIDAVNEKLLYKVTIQNKGLTEYRNCTLRIALSDKMLLDTENFVYAQTANMTSNSVRMDSSIERFEFEDQLLLEKSNQTRIHVMPNERSIVVDFQSIPKHRGNNATVLLIPVIPEDGAESVNELFARAHLQTLKGLGKVQYTINPVKQY